MDLNKAQDIKEGITCSPYEPDSVLIEFIDDEEDSYFDINLGGTSESDEFEFQVSLSSQSSPEFCHQSPADELFHDGQIVPLKNIAMKPGGTSLRCRELSPDHNHGASGSNRRFKEEEEVIETRKPSKMLPLLNGGIMKLLIKFAPEKFRLSFFSTMKSHCFFYHPAKSKRGSNHMNQKTSPGHWKLVLPFNNWIPPWKSRVSQKSSIVINKSNTSDNQQARKLMMSENNDAEKLDASNSPSSNLRRGNPNFGSNPSSIWQSPACHKEVVREKGVMERHRSNKRCTKPL